MNNSSGISNYKAGVVLCVDPTDMYESGSCRMRQVKEVAVPLLDSSTTNVPLPARPIYSRRSSPVRIDFKALSTARTSTDPLLHALTTARLKHVNKCLPIL